MSNKRVHALRPRRVHCPCHQVILTIPRQEERSPARRSAHIRVTLNSSCGLIHKGFKLVAGQSSKIYPTMVSTTYSASAGLFPGVIDGGFRPPHVPRKF